MKYKCIIFDCDGVLVDSEELSIQILVDMARAFGADINLSYALKHFSGRSLEHCGLDIEHKAGKKLPDDFMDIFRQKSYFAFDNYLQPVKGIPELLNRLTLPFCVASSGPLEKIERNLAIVGLTDKFTGRMFSSYEIGSWKPEPDIFLHAAQQMSFTPRDCLVIEDSLAGVLAAQAGGFDVLAYVEDTDCTIFDDICVKTFADMNTVDGLL